MNYTIDASTEALRSALERINEALYVDENTGEWRLPAAFDANFIDAALSSSPPPSTEGLRELASEARFLLNRLSELSFDDLDDHTRDFNGHVEPSISRLGKLLDAIEARAALSGSPPPSTEGLRGALERCERAMKPFAARVYNDNHDITVTDTYRLGIQEYTAIYLAHKAARAALSGSPPPSTEALRSELAEGRQAAVELASLMREGAHDKEEIKGCKVVDKIDAALSASPEKFHNVCCNKCGYVGPATSAMGQHPDCNYIGSRVPAGSPAPSTEGLSEWLPIETAPKDGTEILTFSDRIGLGTMVLYWADGYWREKANGLGLKYGPTHWMPLLPAPDAARTALAGSAGGRIKVTARGVSIRVHTWALAELASEMAGPGAEIRYVPEGSDDGWCVWTEGETWPDEDDFRYHLFALEVKRLRRERHSLAPSAGVTAPETNGD